MNKIIVVILFIFFSGSLIASDSSQIAISPHRISLKTQFVQFKDEFNYGLVFSGVNIACAYSYTKVYENSTFSYDPDINFGANYNKGIGIAWGLKPIDVFYGFKLNDSKSIPITLGGYVATDYNWQLYPELQSGHNFWFSSFEIGPKIFLSVPFASNIFNITFSTSFAGVTSRPTPGTETYFYSLNFLDMVSNAHSNLKFGFNNLFNHTNLEIELVNQSKKRLSFAYEFEYFAYYDNPTVKYLAHSFNLKWRLGKL